MNYLSDLQKSHGNNYYENTSLSRFSATKNSILHNLAEIAFCVFLEAINVIEKIKLIEEITRAGRLEEKARQI